MRGLGGVDLPDVLLELDAGVGAVRALGEVRPRHVHQQALGRVALHVRAVQALLPLLRLRSWLALRGLLPYFLESHGLLIHIHHSASISSQNLVRRLLLPMLLRSCGRESPHLPKGLLPFGRGIRILQVPAVVARVGRLGVEPVHVDPHGVGVTAHEAAVRALPLLSAQPVEGVMVWGLPLLAAFVVAVLVEERPLWADVEVVLEVVDRGRHVEAGRAHHVPAAAAAAPLHLEVGDVSLR